MVFIVADNSCQGDPENASRKILQDFRMGRMGPVSLQLAPETEQDDGQSKLENLKREGLHSIVDIMCGNEAMVKAAEEVRAQELEAIERRAARARDAAEIKGLELPPVLEEALGDKDEKKQQSDEPVSKPPESEVGKGLFDGW